jgi:alkanesulfonate monooxygenase SsuD/methylene tetrahydromethanopterin reductase-like flavin-dependent oxidoreductase (luciferase family)
VQTPLPVWTGVGGAPGSAERAGRLGLPMVLGYIGGPLAHARQAVDIYRAAGTRAGCPDKLLSYCRASSNGETRSVHM